MLTKEVLAAILFLMLVQSGASSTSSSVSASPSVTNSYSSTTPGSSSSASNSASPMGSSSQTYTPTTSTVTNTVTITVTNTVTSDVTSTVTHIVNQANGMTISPTAAGTWGVSPSSMLSVVWNEWKTEKETDCKEKCCDTGGLAIKQVRNCTIHQPRCNFTECMYYGPIEREISCYMACSHCMPSKGYSMAGPKLLLITAALLISIAAVRP
ncbi:uncharacterized protein [Porites lutea]|uniref:uncharacterized protein n=1 Tax=Porites lutea TaxID=51062 RepID=UPI003CC5E489